MNDGGSTINYCHNDITVRPPLAGGKAQYYEWNALDMIIKVARSGQNDVSDKSDVLRRDLIGEFVGS